MAKREQTSSDKDAATGETARPKKMRRPWSSMTRFERLDRATSALLPIVQQLSEHELEEAMQEVHKTIAARTGGAG